MGHSNDLTIGILSWKAPKTLSRALTSYQESGLFKQADRVILLFQEISAEDKKLAKEFNIEYLGINSNLGIAGGYKKILENVNTKYFLFLEDDWVIRDEYYPQVPSQISQSIAILNSNEAEVVRLRSRIRPGSPLWTLKFKGHELERPEHLLDSVHWIANPNEIFPSQIFLLKDGWYTAKSQNANWTNNPHLIETNWAKKILFPHLGNSDIESSLKSWWEKTNFTVAQGSGLFTHDRLCINHIEFALHKDEALSNHMRRENNFFEIDILEYLKENHYYQGSVIDIGANIGNHTVFFANYLNCQKIVCFEPEPNNFKLLQANTKYPNIEIHQQAISDKKTTLKMTPNRRNMGASMITTDGPLPITTTTIDDLKLDNVTLIKIDVEGHEPQVIKGSQKTINKFHPLILIEDKNLSYSTLLPEYAIEKAWPSWSTYLYKWVGKPCLISAYTPTLGLERHLKSRQNFKNSLEILNGQIDSYPGHLRRWDHLPPNLNPKRVYVFTDTADVLFQKPFPSLLSEYIYVANEGEIFENNSYWRSMIRKLPHFSVLNKQIIYNVGTFACNGQTMDNWIKFIHKHRRGVRYNSVEQMIFNVWLRLPENIPRLKEIPDLFCSIYANLSKGLAKIENGKVYNNQGQLFTVVHFNGSTKDLLLNQTIKI